MSVTRKRFQFCFCMWVGRFVAIQLLPFNSCCCKSAGFKGGNISDDSTVTAFVWITKQASYLGLDVGKVLSNVAEYRTSSVDPGLVLDLVQECNLGFCQTYSSCNMVARSLHNTASDSYCFLQYNLKMSPSSAACERIWSVFGNTHTKSRNKLACKRVEKLVSI